MVDPYNKNRCDLFNYIIENPGEHFSGIMRALNLNKRALAYHLEKLVEEGIVVSKAHGIFTFYYPYGAEIQKPLRPTQRKIADLIKEEPCTTGEITEIVQLSQSSIYYHLTNLVKQGIIEKNGNYWYLKKD